jgi:hypothetical protein
VPFKISKNDVGKTRYLPAASKEWKESVYTYNTITAKNYPVYNLHLNSLIQGYFSMYFNNRFLKKKFMSGRKKSNSTHKIYVSKAEVKHTNSKAIVTIYVYNRERVVLLKKINNLRTLLVKLIIIRNKAEKLFSLLNQSEVINQSLINNDIFKGPFKKQEYLQRICKTISVSFIDIRKYMLRLSLNNSKFKENFLYRLSNYVSKYYGKKVEFNIVNLKSIAYNGDIFTEILTAKIRKDISPITSMNDLLSKVTLPEVNIIAERSRVLKSVDYNFAINKYKNINISSIINKNNLSKDSLNRLLNSLFLTSSSENKKIKKNLKVNSDKSSYLKIRDIILDNIRYKNMGGVKLRVKGRLTKRYRADRAVYKMKWKGGLKNIDSAYRGLSTVLFRGQVDSNVEVSTLPSKRRIGSFAVKGWFSGK